MKFSILYVDMSDEDACSLVMFICSRMIIVIIQFHDMMRSEIEIGGKKKRKSKVKHQKKKKKKKR